MPASYKMTMKTDASNKPIVCLKIRAEYDLILDQEGASIVTQIIQSMPDGKIAGEDIEEWRMVEAAISGFRNGPGEFARVTHGLSTEFRDMPIVYLNTFIEKFHDLTADDVIVRAEENGRAKAMVINLGVVSASFPMDRSSALVARDQLRLAADECKRAETEGNDWGGAAGALLGGGAMTHDAVKCVVGASVAIGNKGRVPADKLIGIFEACAAAVNAILGLIDADAARDREAEKFAREMFDRVGRERCEGGGLDLDLADRWSRTA